MSDCTKDTPDATFIIPLATQDETNKLKRIFVMPSQSTLNQPHDDDPNLSNEARLLMPVQYPSHDAPSNNISTSIYVASTAPTYPPTNLAPKELKEPSFKSVVYMSNAKRKFRLFIQSKSLIALILLLLSVILTAILVVKLNSHSTLDTHFKSEFQAYPAKEKLGKPAKGQTKFLVAIDAGSTGTRSYVYRWEEDPLSSSTSNESPCLPEFHLLSCFKLWPGLSAFADDSNENLSSYIRVMLKYCAETIADASFLVETPIYLFATAGLRLVKEEAQKRIMDTVLNIIVHSPYSFQIHPTQIQMITGELEGVLAWLSVNYLAKTFRDFPSNTGIRETPHQSEATSLGLVDIGGGSMQVAYEVHPQSSKNDLTSVEYRLKDGSIRSYTLFSKSLLGFGMNEARKNYHITGERDHITSERVPLACYPNQYHEPKVSHQKAPISMSPISGVKPFNGTGDFDQCYSQVHELLKANSLSFAQSEGSNLPLLRDKKVDRNVLDGISRNITTTTSDSYASSDRFVSFLPKPKTPMTLIGVAECWYAFDDVFHLGSVVEETSNSVFEDPKLQPHVFYERTKNFCRQNWDEILTQVENGEFGVIRDEAAASTVDKLRNQCFKSAWILSLLNQFFGIPIPNGNEGGKGTEGEHPIQMIPKNAIHANPLTWAIGVPILYHHMHPTSKLSKKEKR